MSTMNAKLADLVIPIGTADSNVLTFRDYEDALMIGILTPTVLDAHSYVIQVTEDETAVSPVWHTLQVGNPPADYTLPGTSKAVVLPEIPAFQAFKIHDASGNVAASRTFKAFKSWYSGFR